MELILKKYGTYANPQNDMIGNIIDACAEFSYTFSSGVYFFTGEIDCGAWSFAYSLTSNDKNDALCTHFHEIILNGKSVDLSEVQKISFNVGQRKTYCKNTFESVLKQALKNSKSDCTVHDICKKFDFFGIDEWLLNQKMSLVNAKIWYLSAAIGLAENKKIFVFPWLSNQTFTLWNGFLANTIRILNQEDVIVIVPCSDKIRIPPEKNFNVVRMNSLFEVDFDNVEP